MTQSHPIISVITVCKNDLHNLERTLESIHLQKEVELESIVVDGASCDGTPVYLKRSAGSTWISEPDRGIFDAMNKGVHLANGSWINFMNAGDEFTSNDALASLLEGSENCDIVYGDSIFSYGDTVRYKKSLSPQWIPWCPPCVHQSMAIRADVVRRFPYDVTLDLVADYKSLLLAFQAGHHISRKPIPVAKYDRKGTSDQNWIRALDQWCTVGSQLNQPLIFRGFKLWLREYYRLAWRVRSKLPPEILKIVRSMRNHPPLRPSK